MKKQRRGLDRHNVLHDGWRPAKSPVFKVVNVDIETEDVVKLLGVNFDFN